MVKINNPAYNKISPAFVLLLVIFTFTYTTMKNKLGQKSNVGSRFHTFNFTFTIALGLAIRFHFIE